MKVAFVYDRVNKFGGAERILLALNEIWPKAPLYTAVYDFQGAPWAKRFEVIPSFLQNFPLAKNHHEIYPWMTPLAFESFNFDNFDLVISITSAEAKGIITKPQTCHICYCLTPTRYLWSHYREYFKNDIFRVLTYPLVSILRKWDRVAAQRPDFYLSISQNVSERINKYYQRDSKLIYPPIEVEKFIKKVEKPAVVTEKEGEFYLVVSRLVVYKKIDIVIKAFNELSEKLVVIGSGREKERLSKLAGPNIKFIQNLTDKELAWYYQNCVALIMSQEEDLGLISLEVQAAGKPVIAYSRGGAKETVLQGKTGEFFSKQSPEAILKIIKSFRPQKYQSFLCRNNAKRFSKEIFKEKFKKAIEILYKEFKK